MAILVQSFLNSATKLSTTATTSTTVIQLKTLVNAIEGVSTSTMQFYIVNPSTTATVLVSGTLGSYGITTATTIYSSNTISTLTIPVGITATSFTGSYPVAVGTFNYDSYGAGFSIRKDSGPIDAYIAQVLALPALSARNYVFDQIDPLEARPFTYGQALISFTLNANGTFSNVVCTYGAGGYSASSGQLTMLGTQLLGGVSPGNDIVWDYVCAGGDGVITSFTYASGTPPVGRLWTFVPANGDPSFTRAMQTPSANVELPGGIIPTWNIATAGGINLGGTGTNELDPVTTPAGTSFNIYATELGTGGGADKVSKQLAKLELAQLRRQAGGNTSSTFYRALNVYDIDLLADKYTSNTSTVGTTSTLTIGRPWVSYISAGLQVFLQTAPITGTTWTDASGNGNNATIVNTYEGSYAYASDHGGGITLTGASGAGLDISGYNLATDGGTYSVEVVASVSSTNYWSSLFGNDDFTLNKGVVAYYGNSSNFYISTPTSNGVYAPVSLATRQNINQYIITVTGNTVKFYLNGVSQALTNNTGGSPGFTASSGAPTNGLMIGARHPNAGTAGVPYDSAGGTYYLVRVYNTLLSQTDVTANYNAIKTQYGL